ncbi:alpha/beta hydrolase [Mesorhizobium sp. KR9-304]|uniref:alpha/beta fold hydrolase n=1 Tax=Mesorhizobium sp. KR9-304 TaxID=3156614 RepID=UPI0032B4B514
MKICFSSLAKIHCVMAIFLAQFFGFLVVSSANSQDCTTEARCHVQLDTGIDMAYTDAGPKDGKPIVFVHGLTDNLYMWSLVTEKITALDPAFRLVSIDLRGHGESSMPSGKDCPNAPQTCFTAKLYAEDLHDFLGKMGIEGAFVVGQSMGSIVAQQIALDYPQDVAGIVLVATSGNVGGNPVLKWLTDDILLGSWKPALAKKGMDTPEALWSALPADADPQALQWMKDNWVGDRFAPADFIDKMSELTAKIRVGTFFGATKGLDQYNNLTRLENLKVPAFLLWGVQDAIFEFDRDQVPIIAALTKAASDGHTKAVWKQYGVSPAPASGGPTDVGHSVAWELPEQTALDIVSFIRTGQPTPDLYRIAEREGGKFEIVTEKGKAHIKRFD